MMLVDVRPAALFDSLMSRFLPTEVIQTECDQSLGVQLRDVIRVDLDGVPVGLHATNDRLWLFGTPDLLANLIRDGAAPGDGPLAQFATQTGFRDILNDLSSTILVAEVRRDAAVVGTEPGDAKFDAGDSRVMIGDSHPGGGHMLTSDGAVQFITNQIDPAILNALLTAAGGERGPALPRVSRRCRSRRRLGFHPPTERIDRTHRPKAAPPDPSRRPKRHLRPRQFDAAVSRPFAAAQPVGSHRRRG